MTMMRTWDDLVEARSQAVLMHSDWKQRSHVSDLMLQHKWSTIWSDLTGRNDPPLVEDLYTEALEDKAYTAAGLHPQIIVAPNVTTRADRGERQAAKKRKVYVSYALNSRFSTNKVRFFMDWWKEGAAFAFPHSDQLWNPQAQERHPFFIRIDPRQVFPMAHDSRGKLTAALIARVRRVIDIENEWNISIKSLLTGTGRDYGPTDMVEELIWVDNEKWGWAVYDANYPKWTTTYRYMGHEHLMTDGSAYRAKVTGGWIIPPVPHKMSRCPLVEMKRATGDSYYRGALDVMIPQLRNAHNVMARLLKDIDLNIFAPKVHSGILNIEEWGPEAMLETDGSPNAGIDVIREPMDFGAMQVVQASMEAARNSGKYPQQRSGEPGASINSAKGSHAVMGGFNSEQAAAQADLAQMIEDTLSITAEFDEKWCGGSKEIMGFDEGEAYSDKYDPRTLFNSMPKHDSGIDGDYRVLVSYGGGPGLDAATYLVQLGTAMQLKGTTYMRKAGLVDNAETEQVEMLYDDIMEAFKALMAQQGIQGGNLDPMLKIADKLETHETTARQAVMDTIKETFAVPAGGAGGGPGGANPVDTIKQARSMASGGMPSSEGQPGPGIGPELAGVLPSGVRRALAEEAPGGTAA